MSALANNFKTKFAGLLRGLLRHVDSGEETGGQTMPSALIPQSEPAPYAPMVDATSQPMTAPATHIPGMQAPIAAQAANESDMSEVEMPLLPILEKLPPDLRSKWMVGGTNLGAANVCISVDKILPQLSQGAVNITFGELRCAAPGLFRMGEEYDSLPIVLPLGDVLARLNPILLARNPGQRAITPPPEIAGPFGSGAQGVTFANTLLKPTPATTHFIKKPPAEPEPIKMPSPVPLAPPPPSYGQRTVTPAPSAPTLPMSPRINKPAQSVPAPAPAPSPVPFKPATRPATPPVTAAPNIPAPAARPVTPSIKSVPNIFAPAAPASPAAPTARATPAVPVAPTVRATPAVPIAPTVRATPTVPVAPTVRATPAVPIAPEGQTVLAALAALSEAWPETLRLEIIQLNLQTAQVALPVVLVEPALKRGRVVFPWLIVRSWIRPQPPGPSNHDGIELELPLKVLAPLFVPRQKKEIKPKTQPALPPSSIPNLFFGFPQPQPEELAPPLNAPDVVPLVQPLDAKLAETDYYVWGDGAEAPRSVETEFKRAPMPATDFSSRRATPKEIIERALKLPNVVGAIVALPDGLKVAFHLPPDLNPDTVAAFLPQLFSRVSQCSKELRMGELNNLNFTIGNVPWKIFRVNAVYFAAFGRAGEPLPTAQLAVLAGELDRKK
jgi:predicted regulator of Ras-like GTPase activity (Roadblock/LC7/MglB family)